METGPERTERIMRGHLTDAEMTEALGEQYTGSARAHLADCAICRVERDRLRVTLAGIVQQTRVEAKRSEAFWERQRRQIASRLGRRRQRTRPWRWVWASAAVGLAALAAVWLHGYSPRAWPGPEADHALLIAVECSLQTSLPTALRPAALLAGEFERADAESSWGGQTPKGEQL
jgi:hypothetical protein